MPIGAPLIYRDLGRTSESPASLSCAKLLKWGGSGRDQMTIDCEPITQGSRTQCRCGSCFSAGLPKRRDRSAEREGGSLKRKLECDLHEPGLRGFHDVAEQGSIDAAIDCDRAEKLSVIEGVEGFETKLQSLGFS